MKLKIEGKLRDRFFEWLGWNYQYHGMNGHNEVEEIVN